MSRRSVVAIGCAALLLLVVLWLVPKCQVREVTTSESAASVQFAAENEARRTLAQIVLGIFGLGALFATWKRVWAAERAVEIAQDGQHTERFTKAVEQLAAVDEKQLPRLEIRLGGIYALERLSQDSCRDHLTIIEVLTAYIRHNAPVTDEALENGNVPEPRTDIQAVLDVLHRKNHALDQKVLDLSKTDLRGASFRDIGRVTFFHSNLRRARFDGTNICGRLTYAQLESADLSKCLSLKQEQLEGAQGDPFTRLPPHLKRPNGWPAERPMPWESTGL